jgi:hypothetical protein
MTVTFLIVEKNGTLKETTVKNINKDELYKKCGFRKPDGFECRTTWENVKVSNHTHTIQLWAREDGKNDTENKYEFPPPVDTNLFFGSCALIQINNSDESIMNLTKDLWLKIYEVLFGGFDDLDEEDDDEVDELNNVKKTMKTKKTGYLKDGFVVDDSDEEENEGDSEKDEDESFNEEDETDDENALTDENCEGESDDINNGSELEEEDYDYE